MPISGSRGFNNSRSGRLPTYGYCNNCPASFPTMGPVGTKKPAAKPLCHQWRCCSEKSRLDVGRLRLRSSFPLRLALCNTVVFHKWHPCVNRPRPVNTGRITPLTAARLYRICTGFRFPIACLAGNDEASFRQRATISPFASVRHNTVKD